MATKIWRGDAPAVAQVSHVTPSGVSEDDVFTLTIGNKTVTFTATKDDIGSARAGSIEVVGGLIAAWNASEEPEIAEVTASEGQDSAGNVTHVILTADTAGKPFTVTSSVTGSSSAKVVTTTQGIDGKDEIQRVTLQGTTDGGDFTLTFDGQTTGAIAYNATAATLKTALEALSNIDPGDVAVTGAAGGPYTITFGGQYKNTNVALITADASGLTTSSTTATIAETLKGSARSSAVQAIVWKNLTAGTWTATFQGQTTASIAFDATAATVQTRLESLGSIGSGNVSVNGGYDATQDAALYIVEFVGELAGVDVGAKISVDASAAQGGEALVQRVVDGGQLQGNEVQWVYLGGATAGTYTLTVGSSPYSVTTPAIDYDATPATVRSKLLPATEQWIRNWQTVNGSTSGNPPYGGVNANDNIDVLVLGAQSATVDSDSPTNSFNVFAGTFLLVFGSKFASGSGGPSSGGFDWSDAAGTSFQQSTNVPFFRNSSTGGLNNKDVPAVVLDGGGLTGASGEGVTQIVDGKTVVFEKQSVTVNATGGTFTLTYEGQTTAATAYNASAATLKTNLEALSTINTVNVTGTGTAADPYIVEFIDILDSDGLRRVLGWDVSLMTANSASLTGGDVLITLIQNGAAGTSEVQTLTISATGGTFTLTFNDQETSAIAYDATAATVDTELESLNTIGSGNVAVTGSAGGPYTITFGGDLAGTNVDLIIPDGSSLTGASGTGAATVTEDTASSGPHHWDEPDNWSPVNVPVNSDDVVFADMQSECWYGLNQSGITLTSLTVTQRYGGQIGLPVENDGGYYEYRDRYLTIGATTITVGTYEGLGISRMLIDVEAVTTTATIIQTGTGADNGLPAVILNGTNTNNAITVIDGEFGSALHASETANFSLVQRGGTVHLGDGVTLSSLDKTAGELKATDSTLNGALIIRA